MIYDSLSNIDRYLGLDASIVEGLRFLQEAAADLAAGHYPLSGESYANVDEYVTKVVNPVGFETHRKYVDIQYLLSGEERVLVRPLEKCRCTVPYDAGRDAAFYEHDVEGATEVRLGGGYFVILFPNDAHEPQLAVGHPQPVRKVVVKVV